MCQVCSPNATTIPPFDFLRRGLKNYNPLRSRFREVPNMGISLLLSQRGKHPLPKFYKRPDWQDWSVKQNLPQRSICWRNWRNSTSWVQTWTLWSPSLMLIISSASINLASKSVPCGKSCIEAGWKTIYKSSQVHAIYSCQGNHSMIS